MHRLWIKGKGCLKGNSSPPFQYDSATVYYMNILSSSVRAKSRIYTYVFSLGFFMLVIPLVSFAQTYSGYANSSYYGQGYGNQSSNYPQNYNYNYNYNYNSNTNSNSWNNQQYYYPQTYSYYPTTYTQPTYYYYPQTYSNYTYTLPQTTYYYYPQQTYTSSYLYYPSNYSYPSYNYGYYYQ